MNRFISFMTRHSLLFVTAVAIVVLTSGFVGVPFWDEDEPRFAAIAQTMVETGNWTVPLFNGELAVDKPVLMHWCMAACFSIFGMNEIAARLPAALAALLTSLALLRLGTRCFSVATGVVAALAYLGCLLVAIESHAATPDSILVALSTWATILLIEPFLLDRQQPTSNIRQPAQSRNDSFVSVWHAVLAGSLLGLGVLCKGPIGYVGPLVVVVGWVWLFQCLSGEKEQPAGIRLREQVLSTLRHVLSSGIPSALHTIKHTRLLVVTIAAVFVAAPWYVSVGVQTDWEWTKGFFFVHNVGRFVAPMETFGRPVVHPCNACRLLSLELLPPLLFLRYDNRGKRGTGATSTNSRITRSCVKPSFILDECLDRWVFTRGHQTSQLYHACLSGRCSLGFRAGYRSSKTLGVALSTVDGNWYWWNRLRRNCYKCHDSGWIVLRVEW